MLAGSMYVKGQPSQTESSFKYVTTQSSGSRIQASVGNRDIINGFYSPVEDRINTFKQPKASVQKWKEIVGVKSDEAVFSGLADWLGGMKPDRQLSKEEVNKFIKDNRIEIKEVVKGKDGKMSQSQMDDVYNGVRDQLSNMDMIDDVDGDRNNPLDVWYNNPTDENYDTLGEFTEERGVDLNFIADAENDGTKFSQYQLPGGENYKEVLITLPGKLSVADEERLQELIQKKRDRIITPEENEEFNRLDKKLGKDFQSSHFDETNIITHLRMNTRTDADGKKVLFLEEVQSDWGQKGKREGFEVSQEQKIKEIESKIETAKKKQASEKDFLKRGEIYSNEIVPLELALSEAKGQNRITKVPSAPYVTNTNAWVKLGLKVALKEAVRQGADRIAWTTGDQQNERYDLSNKVDEIMYGKVSDGVYEVSGSKQGTIVFGEEMPETKLSEYLGKDIAEKIISNEGTASYNNKQDDGSEVVFYKLKTRDLKVGGKGMKAFYGDAKTPGIIGNVAKALVKELTGKDGQIEESQIVTSGLTSPDNVGIERSGNGWILNYGNKPVFKTYEEAVDARSKLGTQTQPAIDITPELKTSVQGGMPQFSVGNRSEDDLRADGTGKERKRALSDRIDNLNENTFQKIKDDAKTYFQKPNKQTKDAVEEFMKDLDTLDVAEYVLSDPKIPDSSLVWMAAETSKRLTKEIEAAKGDDVMVQKLSDKQAEIFNEFAKKATSLGQAVQAFIAFADDPNAVQFHFNKIVRRLKDLKVTLTDEQSDTIKEKLRKVGQAKDGIPKDEAIIELSHYLAGISPVSPMEVIQALWYAKILSGASTQSKNLLANMYNTFAEVGIMATRESIKNVSLMPYVMALKGLAGGFAKGAVVARDITKTGLSKQDASKYFNQNALETFSWGRTKLGKLGGGKVGTVMDYTPPLNVSAWKYVGRLLSASDALFSTANQEAFANMYAWVQASKEGKEAPSVNNYTRANQLLNNTKGKISDAEKTAKLEGYKPGTDRFTRRVIEIISQSRGSDLLNAAEKFGAKVTLNYEPTGFIKPIYDTVVGIQKSLPIAKLWVPFTRIVANLTEQMLDYSPAGLVKAAIGRENPISESSAKLSSDDRINLLIKSAMAVGALALFAQNVGEDDDDWFEITAGGTGDIKKNYELQGEEWRPYTITLKDGTKINYADWPIRGILAGLGAVRDGIKYGKEEGETTEDMLRLYGIGYASTLYDNSIMKGLADFIDIFVPSRNRYAGKPVFNEDGEQTGVDRMSYVKDGLSKWSAQQAKSVLVSNLTQQVLKMADEAQGDPIKIAKGGQVLYRDIPYLNDNLKPVIDVFGDPVSPNTSEKLFPFYKVEQEKKNKMLEMLHDNKLFVGVPGNRNMLTLKGTSRPMNEDELYEYQKLSGEYTKDMIYKIMDESGGQRKEIIEAKLNAAVSTSRARAYADILVKSFTK
jgi:hypothetical protein